MTAISSSCGREEPSPSFSFYSTSLQLLSLSFLYISGSSHNDVNEIWQSYAIGFFVLLLPFSSFAAATAAHVVFLCSTTVSNKQFIMGCIEVQSDISSFLQFVLYDTKYISECKGFSCNTFLSLWNNIC